MTCEERYAQNIVHMLDGERIGSLMVRVTITGIPHGYRVPETYLIKQKHRALLQLLGCVKITAFDPSYDPKTVWYKIMTICERENIRFLTIKVLPHCVYVVTDGFALADHLLIFCDEQQLIHVLSRERCARQGFRYVQSAILVH